MTARQRPVIRVVPGVCPVPRPAGACGGRARFFACGWRCAEHGAFPAEQQPLEGDLMSNPLNDTAPAVNLRKTRQTTGICEHCKQHRPVWQYKPDHGMHLHEPARWTCRWCVREDNGKGQPWLCVRCYSAESLLEEETPLDETEAAVMNLIARQSARYERQQAEQARAS